MTTPGTDGRAVLLERAIRAKRAAARCQAPRLPSRPASEPARLGEMQRALWLLQRMEPGSPAYNLTSAFRVPELLDVGRLERGLARVVSRHRILRSTFRPHRDGALQVVHPPSPIEVEALEAGEGEALAAAVREVRRPFDLETGPLVRLLLVEEPRERLLVLVLHHILADERSLGFLWRELADGYDGREVGVADPAQYEDYVHWLEGRDPSDRAKELDLWRRRLDPWPDELALPFERPSGRDAGGRAATGRAATGRATTGRAATGRAATGRAATGRLLSRRLDADVGRRVRHLASAIDATPFAVYAFAFRLLLHRYTEGRDVAFATPASTRSHPATAEMIGYFLNPVAIRAPIDEEQAVERAVADFSREMRECLAHAAVPFDALVEALSPPRRRDRHPIFQTLFVYQETAPPPELGGIRLEPITLDLGESKFDLTLFVSEGEGPLEIAVEYRADRFAEVWMRNLLGHYETLVGRLAQHRGRPARGVPMLRPGEVEELRLAARGAPIDGPQTALLPRQVRDQARRSADAPAVIGGGEAWSWGELERTAGRIARELTRRGARPGDRVALYLDRSPWMIAGLLGCHWAGAAYVPLDPAYPSARNRDVLEDAEVAAVLSRSAVLDRLPAGGWPTIDVEALEDDGAVDGTLPGLRPEHPAYLLYTSGSTGRPKGVVVTHGNLRASNGARPRVYGAGSARRFLLLPSIAFDSSVAGIFWTLAEGGVLVIPTDDEARDPRRLARLIVEKRVTSLLSVPSLYGHILEAGGEGLRGLETAIVAGESCPPRLVAEHFRVLPQTRLFNEYGPTEATVWATVHEIGPEDAHEPVPVGRPIPGARVEVLDALGRRVPAGIPGEGWIAGPAVARGYWRREDLTAERFVRLSLDGESEVLMYRTGDRLAWATNGSLLFLGRVDEQIKLRGFRIEPGEVEAALRELPEVVDAAVVARDREGLVAFVEATGPVDGSPGDSTADGLRGELARMLPEYMVPSRVVEVPELPRLPNGKVDRGRLQQMPLAPEPSTAKGPQVLDDRERALVSLWEGLLGRPGIGVTDNFFQLGGQSLLAVEMTSAIERDLGVALAPADVFQRPTVRELAGLIEQQGGTAVPAYAHLFPIQPGGRGAPFLFCVPHFFAGTVAARFRGERPVYGLRGVSLRPEGNRGRWRTMRDLGEELVGEIERRFPGESCTMAGYSFGATMAVEAVRLMEERGLPVRRLILIAPMPVDTYRLGPFRLRLDGLRGPVDELSFWQALRLFARGSHPLTRRPYRRAWRLLAIQPWRRLLCLAGKLRTRVGLPLTPGILHADVRLERFRLHANYRPGIVETPTVVFNAREPETDAAATWRPYFAGPFTVHEIPDPHLGEAQAEAARQLILDHLHDAGEA